MREAPITCAFVAMNEDRRSEQADVDLHRVEERPVEPEVVDDPEDRVVRVPALLRRGV